MPLGMPYPNQLDNTYKLSDNARAGIDYSANMVCENCRNIQEDKYGYVDNYYYSKVIPEMKCKKCGLSTNDLLKKAKGEL